MHQENQTDKVPVVIQSATPITYPIIMKMLQSKRLMGKIEIKELKVWEETEKHMAWVMNKRLT
jgi:NitT/TauT family transport system substrate-binding protein